MKGENEKHAGNHPIDTFTNPFDPVPLRSIQFAPSPKKKKPKEPNSHPTSYLPNG
jgi:hypothetical protein